MKKRLLISAILTALLLCSLCPGASAMGFDLTAIDWLNAANSGFSLKDYLDGSQESVSIAGTPVDLDHLLFVDCALNEEAELCLCEATRDARVLDESALPAGCRVELRQEKLRRPDAQTGRDVVEEKKKEAQGESVEADVVLEELPDDGQEHFYLYLVGKPTKLGSVAFIIWTDQFYYCTVDVLESIDEPLNAGANSTSAPPQEPEAVTPESVAPASQSVESTALYEAPAEETTGEETPSLDISAVFGDLTSQAEAVVQAAQEAIFNFTTDPPTYSQPADSPVVVPILTAPTVTIAGDTSCRPNERAVLEARASGENLSYQWYTSLGYYSAPINGATNSYYLPDTSQAGTYGYFCRVTSSAYGQEVYTDSEPVIFNVVDRQLSSVSIDTMPQKLSYTEGESLDTTGLRLLLRYNDGSAEYATSGFTASPIVLNSAGNVNVLVNYKGFNVGYTVSVTSYQDAAQKILNSIRGIGVLTAPYKTTYKVGESLDSTGLSIRAYTSDGNYYDIDWGLTCSPTRFTGSGKQNVTVTFAGKTCTFPVNVEQDNRVTAVWIQNMPANRSYTVGDTINTSGLALQVRTNSGTQTVTSGYSYSPRVATTPGTQTVTVSYEGQSATFTVNVREAQTTRPTSTPVSYTTPSPYQTLSPYATPSPSPALGYTGTPAPSASPTPSAQPQGQTAPAPARKNTGVSTLVKLLFVVAVVALAALIAYVLYLRRQGGDETLDDGFADEPRPSERLHEFFDKKNRRGR